MDNDNYEARLLQTLRARFGPIIFKALQDSHVIEVMLNTDGLVWAEYQDGTMKQIDTITPTNAIDLLGAVAASMQTVINTENPILEGELMINEARIAAILPPVADNAIFCIRKRAEHIYSLQGYISDGALTTKAGNLLQQAINDKKNIVIAGGTGSGKTTFANALLLEIAESHPDDRLVILEDTVEIQVSSKNAVMLKTAVTVTMQKLLQATLRLRPDRIIVGEVRGAEALTLLKAWNTGHPGGLATIHANSAIEALARLEQLVAESGLTTKVEQLISAAVDLMVFIEKSAGNRRIKEIVSLDGLSGDGKYITSEVFNHGR